VGIVRWAYTEAIRPASVARLLIAICPARLAGILIALSLAGVASGLAGRLVAPGLTGVAGSPASRLIASCLTRPTCGTGRLVTICTASIIGYARPYTRPPKAFGALLRLAAACLIGDAAKWLSWTFDSYGDGAVEIGIRNVRLSGLPRSCRTQPYVKIKLVLYRRACCARVFNHRILLYADPRRLEAYHWALFGWNRFGKYDILPPELGVIGQCTIEVEPSPAFAVAFSRQTFQYHHI